jgi:hypothetical protein
MMMSSSHWRKYNVSSWKRKKFEGMEGTTKTANHLRNSERKGKALMEERKHVGNVKITKNDDEQN